MRNLLLMALLVTGLSACAQSGGSNLDVTQVSQMIADNEDIVLIDVRTPEEFMQGHLDGAKLINFYDANFQEEVKKLDTAKKYVVYCRSGGRSSKSVNAMKKLGFSEVYNMSGGVLAWQGAQQKLVK
ncbi:MAG: rhodanese-like domain-containing protein [Bacteroidetes bacterium]|nr:MAG: rhodanese-like domain-containing protein [Bacteroidota bacterium]